MPAALSLLQPKQQTAKQLEGLLVKALKVGIFTQPVACRAQNWQCGLLVERL